MYLWRIDNHHTLYDNSQKGVREMVTQELGIGGVSTETSPSPDSFSVFKAALIRAFFPADNCDRLRAMLNSLMAIPVPNQPVDEKVANQTGDDPMADHVRGLP